MRIVLLSCLAACAFATSAFASPDDDVARGQKALENRDIVAAMEAFTAALEADPGHGAAAYERGRLLLLIGEPENAIADFTTAIVANPANGRALARRAEAKLTVKDVESAIADFDRAIAVSPKDHEVYVLRATFRLKIGNLAGAMADLEQARAVADAETAAKIQAMLDKLKP